MVYQSPVVGSLVSFEHKHRYGVAGDAPLTGIVTRQYMPMHSPNAWSLDIRCIENGVDYGMSPVGVTVIREGGE